MIPKLCGQVVSTEYFWLNSPHNLVIYESLNGLIYGSVPLIIRSEKIQLHSGWRRNFPLYYYSKQIFRKRISAKKIMYFWKLFKRLKLITYKFICRSISVLQSIPVLISLPYGVLKNNAFNQIYYHRFFSAVQGYNTRKY